MRDDLRDVQAGERKRRPVRFERDVGRVVRTNEEVAAGVRKTRGRPREMGPHGAELVPVVRLQHRRHRKNGKRDLGVMVLRQSPGAVAHHLEKAERGAVRAVCQNADVVHGRQDGPVGCGRQRREDGVAWIVLGASPSGGPDARTAPRARGGGADRQLILNR